MWLLHCILLVQVLAGKAAYYHEPSMTTIEPPEKLAKDAFFGYSVAYQNNSIIVGAPNADKDGSVFSCDLATRSCTREQITIGSTTDRDTRVDYVCPDNNEKNCKERNQTHNFLLGANVIANDKSVVVCAPRTFGQLETKFGANFSGYYLPYGRCYAKNISESTFIQLRLITKEDRSLAEKRESRIDSFGWSMDYTDDVLRVGSPVMSVGRVATYDDVWQNRSPSMFLNPDEFGFNFGYSIATGYFIVSAIRPKKLGVAVGTTYGTNGTGKVFIYDENQALRHVEEDTAGVGSMFSAALCAAELGGGSTSLLVGAPAHFTGTNYHTGIVYVYRQWEYGDPMKKLNEIKGAGKNGAFFGFAIANVGDLDSDGKDEIVIAAPYEDGGRGAVYLYAGSALSDGKMDPKWLQKFQPEEAADFRNFGMSLVADKYFGNGCNKLAIGAPGSDKVAVYHCLTVITVNIETAVPDLQNRDNKTGFTFDLCLNATYPPKPENITAEFSVKVTITHPNATLTDAVTPNNYIDYNQTLDKMTNPSGCRKINVTTVMNGDYEAEIQFNVSATLLNDPINSEVFDPSRASISFHSNLTYEMSLRAADCKKKPCKPKLSVILTTSANSPYLIGSSKTETVSVVVRNSEDTAYRPCVRVRASGADLRKAPQCTVVGRERVCRLQGPLYRNSTWNITESQSIELDLSSLTSKSGEIRVTAEVFNRCDISKAPDSTSTAVITLKTAISGLTLESKTDEGKIVYFNKEDVKKGKNIHHTYTIINMGEINWVNIHCDIWLYQEPYIIYNDSIRIYNETTERKPCELKERSNDSSGFIGLSCGLGDLSPKETITVVIPVTVLPGALEKVFKKSNATLKTFIRVHAESHDREREESSTLVLQEATAVPDWVIGTAAVVGALIFLLIAFALYECGFLRRKKKQQLVKLQRDVKRKSMMLKRQSMKMTESDKMQLRNLTFRELLDAAELKDVEEAEEAIEDILDRRVKIVDKSKDKGCRTTVLNGNSSVSNLDLRAKIEMSLQNPNPKNYKTLKKPLITESEI